jgi:hypothetical protein
MPRERITRRQKDIPRLLRERKKVYREKLKILRNSGDLAAFGRH